MRGLRPQLPGLSAQRRFRGRLRFRTVVGVAGRKIFPAVQRRVLNSNLFASTHYIDLILIFDDF